MHIHKYFEFGNGVPGLADPMVTDRALGEKILLGSHGHLCGGWEMRTGSLRGRRVLHSGNMRCVVVSVGVVRILCSQRVGLMGPKEGRRMDGVRAGKVEPWG